MNTIPTPPLADGETYIGYIALAGEEGYHLILLPGDNEDDTWQKQMDWSKSISGDLPNRYEQAILYAKHPDLFKKDWYWSNQLHASDSDFAWSQDFHYGLQHYSNTLNQLRARAVRRLPI